MGMRDIRQWLQSLELDQYAETFEENAIGWGHLADLDHEILKEIGVGVAGHRMTILKAASGLKAESESSSAPPPPEPTSPPLRAASSGDAERRQLTVMFCALVGSTGLSGSMDPEEYRELLAAYQSAASKSIRRYDGYITRYMGDGLLVYFGYCVFRTKLDGDSGRNWTVIPEQTGHRFRRQTGQLFA